MASTTNVFTLSTQGNNDVVDLTSMAHEAVASSAVHEGTCTVFAPHTTVGVTALEFEPGANRDLGEVVDKLVPSGGSYHHNVMDSNGHAHARAAIVGPSVTVPIVGGHLALGTWQSIALVDFDDRPRERTLYVQIQS